MQHQALGETFLIIQSQLKCDPIWENPPYGILLNIEFDVWLIHRANPCSRFRPITHFVGKIKCFVCDCATPPIIKKLRSIGVAMHAYGIPAYYA